MNLRMSVNYFWDNNRAIRFIANAISEAKGECKEVVAKIVAVAFKPDGRIAIVTTETPLTVTQKRNAVGMFQLRAGYVTAKYFMTKAFGTIVEIPSAVLEHAGVKQFAKDCGTVLLNGNGDLHLIGDPLYAYGAFISGDGSEYNRIILPGGIEAHTVRALPVNGGGSYIGVAANTNHGNIWTVNLSLPPDRITANNGDAWATKMRVLDGATVRKFLRPVDAKLTVIGSDGSIVELDGANATAARPVLTVGVKSSLGENVLVTPEAYLVNQKPGIDAIFAGSLTLPVAGGSNVLGFSLVPVHGLDPAALAKAFKAGTGAFA